VTTIALPWPPSSLSGHAKGHWRAKYEATRKHRNWARLATMDTKVRGLPADGDIAVRVEFVPPNNRGDRTNFPNRIKPYLDGIADALGVNDARFLPSYAFATPAAPGCVRFTLEAA
jgi:hypothetical protein